MLYNFITFVTLLIVGYIFGTLIEKSHYKSIRKREKEFLNIPLIALKKPIDSQNIQKVKLVSANVVVSVDYFKKFLASLINFFGGSISSYETLLDRARREAILRLKEEAKDANEIVNLKLETSSITKNSSEHVGAVEVLAYATAIYR